MSAHSCLFGIGKLVASATLLACALPGAAAAPEARGENPDLKPERGTLLIRKDCRQAPDRPNCEADNRAIDFCRNEKDANAVYVCLRANQSPLPCAEKKSDTNKSRCERINRVYQPCKGKRGAELATCVDQNRLKDKRKK